MPTLLAKRLALLVFLIIIPHFDYWSTVWGGTEKSYVNRLVTLQKRCARTIFNDGPRISHQQLFNNLNWMDISNRISFRRVVAVFKGINGISPSYIKDMFIKVSEISIRVTKQSVNHNFFLPKVNISLVKSSFAYKAAYLYNQLLQVIKQARSVEQFKFSTKKLSVNSCN